MASFMKARTLVNPGKKKKRKLSPLQKLFFGSKRQRVAAKVATKNPRKRGVQIPSKAVNRKYRKSAKGSAKATYYANKRDSRFKARMAKISNPSRIMTISLNNPGTTKRKKGTTQMAKSRKRRYTRRKKHTMHNPTPIRRKRRTSYHRRRRNPVSYRKHTRRVYHRRRNRRNPSKASVMSGVGKFGGVLGGAALTHLVNGMLPATLTTGVIGYVTTALVATMQGKLVGSLLKKPALGKAMTTGGYFYLGLKVIADFFPSVGQYLPFGLKGMGIITPSNFYVPQVPVNGSMANFIAPAALPAAIPVAAGMRGINPTNMLSATRRTGRMR